jgi:hypothetical protein
MAAWDVMKAVLLRLRDEQPDVLMQFPMPEVDEGMVPPFAITLAPWATSTAEELHRQFGDDVELTVGALPYPPGRQPRPLPTTAPPAGLLDPQEITVELDGPAVVRSGHTVRHGLLVGNLTHQELTIATNGQVTAVVVDPGTGQTVGGFAGFQTLPGVFFRVAAGTTERIPLLIGTASFTPELGYILPPGSWGIQVPLDLAPDILTRHRRLTPVLPLTITA